MPLPPIMLLAASLDDRLAPLREILADGAYQTEWTDPSEQRRPFVLEGLEWVFGALGAAALAALVIALVVRLVDARAARRAARTRAPAVEVPAPSTAPDRAHVDALAAAGRHAEALHALFLLVVDALGRAGATRLRASSTGREILRAASLDERARLALADLVAAVERALFAQQMVTEQDYRAGLHAAQQVLAVTLRSDA